MDCPNRLSGTLTKWLLEIASGVFVGHVSGRVREEIWESVKEHSGKGRAVLVYSTNGEQRLGFKVHGDTWEPIDYDGLKLMLRPSATRLKASIAKSYDGRDHGFSNASKQRAVKRYSKIQSQQPSSYVVVDLETTGFNPDFDEILEIGAIKIEAHEKVDTFNALVSVNKPIPKNISKLTGINEDMIKDAGKPLDAVLLKFSEFLGDLPIVGHNVDFDKEFLQGAYAKCGSPPIPNRCIDTLVIAKRLMRGVESYKLEALAVQLGIECKRSHRSLSDCETTGQLYRKLLNMMVVGVKDSAI